MAVVNYITRVEVGTKTAPGYSFRTDTDTGIYLIGANNLGISCGDTKIVDINTSGLNAIIGATTPAAGAFTTGSFTGVASFAAGTVSAPSLARTGDVNTGIYFPAADQIALSVGGVAQLSLMATTATVAGNLIVSGAGPHAIGGATGNFAALRLAGGFAVGAGSTSGVGAWFDYDLTANTANTSSVSHLYVGSNSITTAGSGTTHGLIQAVRFDEPNITVVPGDTVTVASTVYIGGAPTEGASNYSLLVASGASRLDGVVTMGSTCTVTGGFGCNTKAAQTAYASGGALAAYGAGANGFDSGANASALHALVVAIRAALVANGIMS